MIDKIISAVGKFSDSNGVKPFAISVSPLVFDSIDAEAYGEFNSLKKIKIGEGNTIQLRRRKDKEITHIEDDIITIAITTHHQLRLDDE
jgi:hypothetical protein